MPYCDSDGIKIYYEIEGSGPEVIMIHGFAANLYYCWKRPGVADTLKAANRLIMMDCRGHGKSDKPTDPALYGEKMVDDITNLMDHLGIEKANFLGYSMGSRLSLELLLTQPERVTSVILGGYVLPEPTPPGEVDPRAERSRIRVKALLVDSLDQVEDPDGREFRRFAESTGSDLKALAACTTGMTENPVAELSDPKTMLDRIQSISVPLMTIIGNDDYLPGDRTKIAMLVPGGCHFLIEGKDHLWAVYDPKFHMAVRAFLNYVHG